MLTPVTSNETPRFEAVPSVSGDQSVQRPLTEADTVELSTVSVASHLSSIDAAPTSRLWRITIVNR